MKVFIGRWWLGQIWSGLSRSLAKGCTAILVGGNQPGAATLIRFYAWHLFGLMLILMAVGIWHLFRVRRDGGIAVPPPELRQDKTRSPAQNYPAVRCWRWYGQRLYLSFYRSWYPPH